MFQVMLIFLSKELVPCGESKKKVCHALPNDAISEFDYT